MFRTYTDNFIHRKTLRALALCCALALPLHGAALAEPVDVTGESPAAVTVLDDQQESVRTAQQRLIALGLLSGSADGVCGPRTGDALRTYQSQNGLEATGHLDEATLSSLTRVDMNALSAFVSTRVRLLSVASSRWPVASNPFWDW